MSAEKRETIKTGPPSNTSAVASITLCAILATGLGGWRLVLGERVKALSEEQSALAAQWTAVSARLEKANAMRPQLELALGGPARITTDLARPRWAGALREVAAATGEGIKLLGIEAREEPEDSGACEIRLSGMADGPQPRAEADRFRMAVEKGVRQNAGERRVNTRFEWLEDELDEAGAFPDQPHAVFVIIVSVAPVNSSPTTDKTES